jgi:riboflavin transporter FmnP
MICFSFTELRRNGVLSRTASTIIPKPLDKAEEIFSEIEFMSVAPLFATLAMGLAGAITVLIGEVILKYALSKRSLCPFGNTK